MVRDAEATARSAESSTTNDVGMCLQWSRQRADIAALYPDASTAWRYAIHRHKSDRQAPRGAMVYWTGGSKGYGHIAVSLGHGQIRSTDVPSSGRVSTVPLEWFGAHWPSLKHVGWADNVNDVIIPGVGEEGSEMNEEDWQRMEKLVQSVWTDKMTVTQPGTGKDTQRSRQQVLRELWQKVTKAT